MLKSLSQPRSPASSPPLHYVSRSHPTSPLSRRDSKSKPQAHSTLHSPVPRTTPPERSRYVDASTQWVSPNTSVKMAESETEPLQVKREHSSPEGASTSTPADNAKRTSLLKPVLEAQLPTIKKRQSPEDPPRSSEKRTHVSPPKRVRAANARLKILPIKYEFCDIEDLVILIANMISELIETNDELPLRSGVLTRFHSRTPPGISVLDYLQRLAKHATLTPPILLSMVYYIDRLCSLYPAFTVTTLTIHRFLITAATVASKGLSDSFWNNSTYARVGGVKLAELGMLELDFLYRVDWKIVPNPEVLVSYYKGLVERSDSYELEDESSLAEDEGDDGDDDDDNDDDEDDISDGGKELGKGSESKEGEATNVKWKAWMDDVSERTKNETDDAQDKGV